MIAAVFLMKTMLVPLDGSALAEHVLPDVRRLTTVREAQVRLLPVIPDQQGDQLLAEMNSKTYPVVRPLPHSCSASNALGRC